MTKEKMILMPFFDLESFIFPKISPINVQFTIAKRGGRMFEERAKSPKGADKEMMEIPRKRLVGDSGKSSKTFHAKAKKNPKQEPYSPQRIV